MSTRQAYEEKFEAKLDELSANIDKLRAKARQADADTRIKIDKQLKDIDAKKMAAQEKLDELRSSGQGAWQDIKQGLDEAADSVHDSLKAAAGRFS